MAVTSPSTFVSEYHSLFCRWVRCGRCFGKAPEDPAPYGLHWGVEQGRERERERGDSGKVHANFLRVPSYYSTIGLGSWVSNQISKLEKRRMTWLFRWCPRSILPVRVRPFFRWSLFLLQHQNEWMRVRPRQKQDLSNFRQHKLWGKRTHTHRKKKETGGQRASCSSSLQLSKCKNGAIAKTSFGESTDRIILESHF